MRKFMFLQQRWFEICQYTQELDLPLSQWQFQWSCNQFSATRLYNAVKIFKWNIMKPFAKKGSVAVFDDLFLPDYPTLLSNKFKKIVKRNFLQRVDEYSQYQFPEFFFWQESFLGRWKCQSIVDSHPQLWAQKS